MTASIPQPLRNILTWIVLCAALGATLYGLVTFDMWSHHLWTPTGLNRLLFLVLIYAATATSLILLIPGRSILILGVLLFLITVAALGPLPVIAVLLFFFSSYVLGLIALPASVPLGLPASSIRILVGVAFYMSLIGTLAHFSVAYPTVYWIIFCLPLAARPVHAVEAFRSWRRALTFRPATRSDSFSLALLGLPLLTALAATARPAIGSDVVGVHLRVPAWMASHHQWPFDFVQTAWALNPLGADWCYSAAYVLSGEYGAKLLDYAFFILIVAMVTLAIRELGVSLFRACLFATLLACTPLAQDLATSLMIESVQAALLVAAFLTLGAIERHPNVRSYFAIFILLGAALNTKFGSFAFVLPIAAIAVYLLVKGRSLPTIPRSGVLRRLVAAFALLLLFGAGPYLYAFLKTGNPIFPYANAFFKSPYFPTWLQLSGNTHHGPFDWLTPYRLIFQSQRYSEFQNGGLGFHWLIALALATIAAWGCKSFLLRSALAVSLFASLLVFPSTANLRYLYPALPLLTVAGAAALQYLSSFSRIAASAALFALTFLIPLNFYFFPTVGWAVSDYFVNPWNPAERDLYVRNNEPGRGIVTYLNQHHRGEPVAFFQTPAIAELDALAFTDGWHNQTYSGPALAAYDPTQYGRYALALGLRLFVAPATWATNPEGATVPEFLARYTQWEYSFGGLELRSLRADAPAMWATTPIRPLPPCEATFIDDQNSAVHYTGSWRQLNHYGSPCEETLTFTDVPGASASLNFNGSEVKVFFTRARSRGIAEVSIDGVPKGKVDESGPGITWRTSVTYSGLTPGPHAIVVRVLGTRSSLASSSGIDIDGFSFR